MAGFEDRRLELRSIVASARSQQGSGDISTTVENQLLPTIGTSKEIVSPLKPPEEHSTLIATR